MTSSRRFRPVKNESPTMHSVADFRREANPPAGPDVSGAQALELKFELLARRKDEPDWRLIARFRNEEDVRAALWAVVFTSQYSAVKALREGATALLAEWPVRGRG